MVSVRLLSHTQPAEMVGTSDQRLREIENCPLSGQFSFFVFSFEPLLDVPDWVCGLPWLLTPTGQLIAAGDASQWSQIVQSYLVRDADHETCKCLQAVYAVLRDHGFTPPGNKLDTLDGFVLT